MLGLLRKHRSQPLPISPQPKTRNIRDVFDMSMYEQPLLTVAIPTYNGAKTIGNMLDLLLPQVDERVEVIVSDNCSTDDTPQIIAEYMKRYPYLQYIRAEKNEGSDVNFLNCMRRAQGAFTMFISDDDIIIENALQKVLSYLERHKDVQLVYMETVAFKDQYVSKEHCTSFRLNPIQVEHDVYTNDKAVFFEYMKHVFGHTSVHIWSTHRFNQIVNPEQFIGTYFLQLYIDILCANQETDMLGVIKGPIIAIGDYGSISNLDTGYVEGVVFRKAIEFASNNGYSYSQQIKFFQRKISVLGRNALIKERAAGVKKTKIINLIRCSWQYPYVWFHLYPYFFVPSFLCRLVLKMVRKKQGRTMEIYVNRPTD